MKAGAAATAKAHTTTVQSNRTTAAHITFGNRTISSDSSCGNYLALTSREEIGMPECNDCGREFRGEGETCPICRCSTHASTPNELYLESKPMVETKRVESSDKVQEPPISRKIPSFAHDLINASNSDVACTIAVWNGNLAKSDASAREMVVDGFIAVLEHFPPNWPAISYTAIQLGELGPAAIRAADALRQNVEYYDSAEFRASDYYKTVIAPGGEYGRMMCAECAGAKLTMSRAYKRIIGKSLKQGGCIGSVLICIGVMCIPLIISLF